MEILPDSCYSRISKFQVMSFGQMSPLITNSPCDKGMASSMMLNYTINGTKPNQNKLDTQKGDAKIIKYSIF